MQLVDSPMRYDPNEALERAIRGYALAFLIVLLVHIAGWYWTHREKPEPPVKEPEMVDVQLLAPPSPEVAVPPPSVTPPTPVPPKTVQPQVKPKPTPQPKKPEVKPKPTKTEPTETDDLAKRLRDLNESFKQQPQTATAQPRPQAKPKPGGSSEAKPAASNEVVAVYHPEPAYPAIAKARHWEGAVKLKVYVLPNGGVGDVQTVASSGHDVLDNAAEAVMRSWRFRPIASGRWAMQTIHFRLR